MSQNNPEAGQAEKKEETTEEKAGWFFRAGEAAEKIWKNKWYQWFLTILFVLALGSGAFAYRYIEQETSVDSVIENYMQYFSGGDWESMYEEAGAGETGIPYSVWEAALSSGRSNSVDSYSYKLTKTEGKIQYYTVTYREKNSDEDKTLQIALRETDEVVYHFFKTYEVTAEPLVIRGATVTVPEGISFTFADLSSDDMDRTEDEAGWVYSLPVLLPGEYEVSLYGDTVEERTETVTAGENSRYFTWLDFDLDEELAADMEEHLAAVVMSVLSETVEYTQMERDYGSMISETYGHDGLEDWNALGTAISDSLKVQATSNPSEEEDDAEGGETDADSGETGDADQDGEAADDAETLRITGLTIDDSEASSYDFVYPDQCKVKLVLECSYSADSSEIDILDPDAEEEQTRTGTIHMEFVAEYYVDAENWQITDCSYISSSTMDDPVEEETVAEEEEE